MHRNITLGYNDFWTSIMDRFLNVNPTSRKTILEWGREEFNRPIERCNNRFFEPLLTSMKLLYNRFVTPPEIGVNRFVF